MSKEKSESIISVEEEMIFSNRLIKKIISFLVMFMRKLVGIPKEKRNSKKQFEVSLFGKKYTSSE